MTDPQTPRFRYHPDPLETGSARESNAACSICGQARGVIYDGPICGNQPEVLCLDCIASGEASRALSVEDWTAEFTTVDVGVPGDVPASVLEEIGQRTPGFRGWQEEHWLYHCGDGAAFLGRAGFEDLAAYPEALEMIRRENEPFGWTQAQVNEYIKSLSPNGDATAYLFRCLRCNEHLAYTDMS